jgi:homogentisate 1,2-dioxygenase
MSEFMGLIRGKYDAKADGFLPGGMLQLGAAAGGVVS